MFLYYCCVLTSQSELGIVCSFYSFVLGVKWENGRHGPKDLFSDDTHVVTALSQDAGGQIVASTQFTWTPFTIRCRNILLF